METTHGKKLTFIKGVPPARVGDDREIKSAKNEVRIRLSKRGLAEFLGIPHNMPREVALEDSDAFITWNEELILPERNKFTFILGTFMNGHLEQNDPNHTQSVVIVGYGGYKKANWRFTPLFAQTLTPFIWDERMPGYMDSTHALNDILNTLRLVPSAGHRRDLGSALNDLAEQIRSNVAVALEKSRKVQGHQALEVIGNDGVRRQIRIDSDGRSILEV